MRLVPSSRFSAPMNIDGMHFVVTVTIGIYIVSVLKYLVSHRFQQSCYWRLIISLVIGAGIAPAAVFVRSMSGPSLHGFVTPASIFLLYLPEVLSKPELHTVDGLKEFFITFLLPIIVATALIFVLLSFVRYLKNRHETRAA